MGLRNNPPEGLKKEKDIDHSQPKTRTANNNLYFIIIGLLVISSVVITFWPEADLGVPSTQIDSGDPGQDYFSSGLTDDIITELSKYTELVVFAHTSALVYDGRSLSVTGPGIVPDARYIRQGSERKAEDHIRVSVQLSDTLEGKLVWGSTYQRDLTANDLFSLQDELTHQVVNAIAGSYGALTRAEPSDARRKPPQHLDSYNCVLRTFEYLHVHDSLHHLQARDCLEGVVELDPDYADGWAWLACTGDFEHSLSMVEKAIILIPNPPPWLHLATFLEYYHKGQYEAALAEARLIETGDFRAPALLAAVNGQLGRVSDAKQALSKMRVLFPGSFEDIDQELVQRNGFYTRIG